MKTLYLLIPVMSFTIVFLSTNAALAQNMTVSHADIVSLAPESFGKQPSWTFPLDGASGTIAITKNADYIAVGTNSKRNEGTIYYLNSQGNLLWSSKQDKMISSVSLSKNGSIVVAGGDQLCSCPSGAIYGSGTVYYFDKTGNMLWRYNSTVGVTGVSVSPDGSYIAAGTENSIMLLDGHGNLLWNNTVTHTNVHFVKVFPDGSVLAKDDTVLDLFDKDGILSWNYTTGQIPGRTVAFATDYKRIAVADEQYGVSLFDINGTRLWNDYVPHMVNTISISSDGSIAIGSQQEGDKIPESFYLFDHDGTELWKYTSSMLTEISNDGNYLVSGTDGGSPSLFFLDRQGHLLWNYDAGRVWNVKISGDGNYVIAGTTKSEFGPGSILFFTNKQSVPEFLFAIPILLVGFVSMMAFYRIRDRK